MSRKRPTPERATQRREELLKEPVVMTIETEPPPTDAEEFEAVKIALESPLSDPGPGIIIDGKKLMDDFLKAHSPKETTTIFTYFEPALQEYENELQLLVKWIQRWEAKGYRCVVLNESHARTNPRFEAYASKVANFWSQNPILYERACWYRWVALEQVGGGAMADYDVMPRTLTPIPVTDDFTIFERGVPSLASGTKSAVGKFLDFIMTLPDTKENDHFSDMLAVRMFPEVKQESLCVQWTDTAWESAPFIHCSHAALIPRGKNPRYKFVDEIMGVKA